MKNKTPSSCFATTDQPASSFGKRMSTAVWQHENDHLDGVLIIDRMTTMDRLSSRKLIKELEDASIRWAES